MDSLDYYLLLIILGLAFKKLNWKKFTSIHILQIKKNINYLVL